MGLTKKLHALAVSGALALGLASNQTRADLYDDFSSGILDTSKWEVRQDYEGQPFTEEYGVDADLENFHIRQNNLGDARTYLVPKHNFTAGEVFDYDIFYNSGSGNRISMLLVDQRDRMGIIGNWNHEFTGVPSTTPYHIKMIFGDGFIDQTISHPDGIPLHTGESPLSIDRHDLTSRLREVAIPLKISPLE